MSFQTKYVPVQFKTLLSVSVLVLVWLLLAAESVNQSSVTPTLEQRVAEKIKKSGKGIILGITTQGEDPSILTDKLLTEVESNRYYAPVFFSAEGTALQRQLKRYGLAPEQLPAMIYLNPQGVEISRSTNVGEISHAIYYKKYDKQINRHHQKNTEYLVALSQALSAL